MAQENKMAEELLKAANILPNSSWEDLSQNILVNAWKKLGRYEYNDEDDIPLSVLFPSSAIFNAAIQEVKLLLLQVETSVELNREEIEDSRKLIENRKSNSWLNKYK